MYLLTFSPIYANMISLIHNSKQKMVNINKENLNLEHLRTLDRRKLLKVGGVAVVGIAAGENFLRDKGATDIDVPGVTPEIGASEPVIPDSEYPEHSNPRIDTSPAEPFEQFERQGLGDFYPFYEQITAIQDVYGIAPHITSRGGDVTKLFGEVAAGIEPSRPDIMRELQGPWGEQKDAAVEAAHQKIEELDVQFAEDVTPFHQERIHQICVELANAFPVLLVTAPGVLAVSGFSGGGGTYQYRGYDSTGNTVHDGQINAAVGNTIDDARVILYHESVHAFEDAWTEARPYMSKEDFAHLLVVELEAVHEVLDTYFSLPWWEARAFKYGEPLMPSWLTPEQAVVDRLEKRFILLAEEDERRTLMLPVEDSERYNRVLHAIGRKVKTIRAKDPEDLSGLERRFIEEYDNEQGSSFKAQLQSSVDELYHFFVGPVQRDGGGFPDRIHPPDGDGSMMTRLNTKVQAARLLAISSIPSRDCLSDPLGSVREAFPYYGDTNEEIIEVMPVPVLQQDTIIEPASGIPDEIIANLSGTAHRIAAEQLPASDSESRQP